MPYDWEICCDQATEAEPFQRTSLDSGTGIHSAFAVLTMQWVMCSTGQLKSPTGEPVHTHYAIEIVEIVVGSKNVIFQYIVIWLSLRQVSWGSTGTRLPWKNCLQTRETAHLAVCYGVMRSWVQFQEPTLETNKQTKSSVWWHVFVISALGKWRKHGSLAPTSHLT